MTRVSRLSYYIGKPQGRSTLNEALQVGYMYNPEAKANAEKDIRDAEIEKAMLLRQYPELASIVSGGTMPQEAASQGVLKYNPETGRIE